MIYLGLINSRMKDFYDLWAISNQFYFSGNVLQEAIRKTFANRKSNIPEELPVAFTEQFALDKQVQWSAFLKTTGVKDTPEHIKSVQERLQEFLLPVL